MENFNTYSIQKFADRLFDLRKEFNLTTQKLANAVGFSQTCISRWERGIREPGITAVVKLARYFDVSVSYLLGLED
ncbi:MAG: helix-turn-helix domain-containing protein [Firmicutes bacterium]|nr:helix-turn-helix domain-containing protein [Bacillota bacterium]